MNSYILHADLHQKLLVQNRIDPITGDAIVEYSQESTKKALCFGLPKVWIFIFLCCILFSNFFDF